MDRQTGNNHRANQFFGSIRRSGRLWFDMFFEKIRVDAMTRKEQWLFDTWWRGNRARLITIYNNEINLDMAILEIAEFSWEGALDAKKSNSFK